MCRSCLSVSRRIVVKDMFSVALSTAALLRGFFHSPNVNDAENEQALIGGRSKAKKETSALQSSKADAGRKNSEPEEFILGLKTDE